ncbi:glycosyl hydrolase family 31 [Rubrobacter marinus]|uniref:Glycosyl hydrolase family 31 n=1 Tax=Rubrobacter marinus TaxID=2653852 RepID=A0A6G8PTE4_9ACTN|nr:glycoside hydrolase family 31 protein [Rubrobacter marinus]QIN77700.1 glycosyl hydrolase family 31 [Rubrobacter marinus]
MGSKSRRHRSSILSGCVLLVGLLVGVGLVASWGTREWETLPPAAGVYQKNGQIILSVPPASGSPGYEVKVAREPFRVTTTRGGTNVLASSPGPARFQMRGSWYGSTKVRGFGWDGKVLRLDLATTSPGYGISYAITPEPGRYRTTWSIRGTGTADQIGMVYDLRPSGHWYGYGEVEPLEQPWPLSAGEVRRGKSFDPSIYQVRAPFWFTSTSAGLWVNTNRPMDHSTNESRDGLGRFYIKGSNVYNDVTFVESTPRAVYDHYIRVTGRPAKIDPSYEQFEKPLWNTWAQFYRTPTQQGVVGYAEGLASNGLAGHAVQVDGGWERRRGDLSFDPARFPDPQAMSGRIHELGYDLGLWVGFYVEPDSASYAEARQRGYLLPDGADRSKPCMVPTPYERDSALVDLANPEARAWYEGKLRGLMQRYRVEGFKFDTVFFDKKCAPRSGLTQADYTRIGAQFVDGFDLQGAGVRVPWWGSQRYGFAMRQMDKSTDWRSLQVAVPQALALSTIGHPFVTTDMIGGSLYGPPPEKAVLVRWAQASSLMPMMYSSTSPLGVTNPSTGQTNAYDEETMALYRAAIEEHRRLAPYIWERAQEAVAAGEPIMKPLFFDFPREPATYTVKDQWMLGDAIMAAPILTPAASRDIYVPSGTWYDVRRKTMVRGPAVLGSYPAPLGESPVFVRQGNLQTCAAMAAFGAGAAASCPVAPGP